MEFELGIYQPNDAFCQKRMKQDIWLSICIRFGLRKLNGRVAFFPTCFHFPALTELQYYCFHLI